MLFISPVFLIYFLPVFIWIYHITKDSYKNHLLLGASLIFYAWGAPKFVFILLLTTAIDFYLVKLMSQKTTPHSRKLFLMLSLTLNLGLLVYFKYMNFFVNNFKEAFHSFGLQTGPMLNIILPIGISFFVFESITYAVDVYTSWLCALAFSMQIYFDFSAYSDMAIGLANMLGFRLNENFNNPFTSSRLKEFWQRWHMSFTRWIKSYLYIPLGGSKISIKRTYLNLWIIFIISGLWHGAAWNYLIWGCVHGVFLILERLFLGDLFNKMGKWVSTAIIFIFIILSTLLLKTNDLSASMHWYGSMFGFNAGNIQLKMLTETKLMLVLGIFFSLFTILPYGQKIQNWWYGYDHHEKFPLIKVLFYVFLWIISISYVSGHQFKSFIYYMF